MPRRPVVPEVLRGKVFRGSTVVKHGILTPDQLRSSAWRRVRRDVYVDARIPADHGLAVAACALAMPKAGLVAGRSAAWLYGVKQASAKDPVDVLIPAELSWWSAEAVRVHIHSVPGDDVSKSGRPRMTTATRTCLDIARWYEATVAVPIIDAMLATRLVTQPDLQEQHARAAGHGVGRAHRVLALCDGRAESPPESVLRVRLILAGLPAPVPQYEVRHQGRFVARVDLGWPESRVAWSTTARGTVRPPSWARTAGA